jgi:3-oxosteroid 1-dehydrogenase|nr:FAD-dependent oxidoreductase [Pseudomonadales bacterium]
MAGSGNWAYETDVVVVGSGAGALTAAVRARDLGLEVLVIEKTGQYGGSSAMSGGVLWLPNSPLVAGAGGSDSAEEGKRYMKSVIDEPHLDKRIDAYVEQIPAFIDFLHRSTHLRLAPLPQFPDMYPDNPDAKMHRCHEAVPFHARALPADEVLNLRPQHPQTALFGLIGWTPSESLILQARGEGWLKVAFSMVARYLLDIPWRLRSRRDRRLVLGGALVGALRHSMLDRGVPLWLNSPFEDFIEEDGRVAGVLARHDGVRARIRARKGVILAAGGFEKNNALRQQYLDQPTDAAWTAGSPGNTGDTIAAATRLGAKLEFMAEGWWGPTFLVPGEPQARMLIIEKNLPGSIIVNKLGQRFVNESSSYTKVTRGLFAANKPGAESIPAYMIFDATYRQRYPIGPMLPSTFQPDFAVPGAIKKAIPSAMDIRELARKLGVDPEGLAATVSRFNGFARSGKDEEFQRGDANYDRYYGDQSVGPNSCLGPIEKAPFYGVKIYPGELGTKGGFAVDENARVLREDGSVIEGLFAIGNCSSPVTGTTYPASGSTLGPAMVFGYVAANCIASA